MQLPLATWAGVLAVMAISATGFYIAHWLATAKHREKPFGRG